MARGAKVGLSIAELEKLLNERRSSLAKLNKQRAELVKKLDAIDREISKLGGAPGSHTAGGRARNNVSLVHAMEAVLRGKGPMRVGDIHDAVLASGYHSSSGNFRGIVNQTLIKEKQFHQVGRGTYTIK